MMRTLPGSNNNTAAFRLNIYIAVVVLLFGVLSARLWYLQIIQGHQYLKKSEENRIRLLRVKAPRGIISDTDGFPLVRNRPSFNVYVIPEDIYAAAGSRADSRMKRNALERAADRLRGLRLQPPLSREDVIKKVERSRRPKFEPILIQRDVNMQTVAYLEEHKIELPGVFVEVEPLRNNIYDETVCHVLGYLGEISEQQLEDKETYPNAKPGDLIGKSGVEKTLNAYLSGIPGGKQTEVNASGRELGTINEKNPVPGHNVALTINLRIQMIAEEALGENAGAVVAVDPENGHILAMVSRPAFNPNLFAGGISNKEWKRLIGNDKKPLRNKTIQNHYAPGSTFKPMIGSALLQEHVVSDRTALHCAGSVRLANALKRCWKSAGHNYLNLKQALEQSCNVFFYRASLELGIDKLAYYAKSYGFSAKTGIELPNEDPGLIPTKAWKEETIGERWYPAETMDAAIGQGYVTVTPLQLAMMTAAIANGGTLYKPMLIKSIRKANGDILEEFEPEVVRQVPIAPEYLQIIREGMWLVVNGKRGSGRGVKIEDFEFSGKTGTAQVVRLQKGEQEDLPEKLRDHGWFVTFAPADHPEIAMAILVEHGMGGSRSAAPVAKYIYERLYKPQDFLVKQGGRILPET
ncbi:penicillin-binding protein 2 [candidate division KSB3 bacterium]|uniref:Penicillin-binding protein 2 n=1 Tax=candidate division KSB3 bacterium TaxID=2044937 RepID=A0A2G6E3I4_9BACT|nr:MAG: penicillin-binding protein 2 [candidate division KSB3 bacterium]PIE29201.1 MAG: penicillin-binding protein 2 [candidate division KSB3 bacterium]